MYWLFLSYATFTCDKGFDLVGQDTLECKGGQWIGEFPVCRENICEEYTLQNGLVKVNETDASLIELSCTLI